jgi:hypothetical protein
MSQGSFLSTRGWVVLLILLAGTAALVLLVWARLPTPSAPVEVPAESETRRVGREIRYNATLSLAVLGSEKVRLDLLRDMLDEDQQLKNFWVKLSNGKTVSDEAGARKAILNTLKAVVEWRGKVDVAKLEPEKQEKVKEIYAAIKRLAAHSPNAVVREEARKAEKALGLS